MEDVIINGVRYVPDPNFADKASFYFMHYGHYFTRLKGKTLDEILAHADEIESGEDGSYGLLYSVIVSKNGKELRRVGTPAHSAGSKDSKDKWNAGKAKWRKEVEADAEIMRLISDNQSRRE